PEHPSFRKVIRSDIDLTPNTTARIDMELTLGAVSEVVHVTAETPLLQTDRSDTGSKIENQQLNTMPSQTRWYRSRTGSALAAKLGSRGKTQLRCCQGRRASLLSQRHNVAPLISATRP